MSPSRCSSARRGSRTRPPSSPATGVCSTASTPSTSCCPQPRDCCACSGSHERRRRDPRVHGLDRLLHAAGPGPPARAGSGRGADGAFQCRPPGATGRGVGASVCGARERRQAGLGARGPGLGGQLPGGGGDASGRADRRERCRGRGRARGDARGDRGALPVRAPVRGGRSRRASPIGDPRLRGIRGRIGARAGRVPHDGAADSLRADASGAGAGCGNPALRSGRRHRPPAGPGGRVLLPPISLIVVVGVLIFVHEAGHLAAAKAVGIQVLRFSLGFGRPILAWRRGETEYWISWIPFGGYVKMAGFEDEGVAGELEGGKSAQPIDPDRAFDRKPLWARLVVILAGVTMNAVFAVLVYTGLAYTGTLEPNNIATTRVDSVVVSDLPPAAQALAALRRGDRITTVNGDSVRTWGDLQLKLANAPPPVTLRLAGRSDSLVLSIAQGDTAARVAMVLALSPYLEPVISSVTSGSAGGKAGLKPGDRILKVNGDTVVSWQDFARVARRNPEHPITVEVAQGTAHRSLTVTPDRREEM